MSYDDVHGEPDDDEAPNERVGRAMLSLRDSDPFRADLQDALDAVLARFLTGEHQLPDDEFDDVVNRACEGVLDALADVRDENVEAHPFGVTEGTQFINHRKPDHMTHDAEIVGISKYGTRLSYARLDDETSPQVNVSTGRFVEDDSFEVLDDVDDDDDDDDDNQLTLG